MDHKITTSGLMSKLLQIRFNLEDEKDLNLAYDIMEGAYNVEARKVRAQLDASGASLADRLKAMDAHHRAQGRVPTGTCWHR